MLTIKYGDIFEEFLNSTDNVVLCHGCNSCNVMGAGIARVISHKFPEAKLADSRVHSFEGNEQSWYNISLPGTLSFTRVKGKDNKSICNLYTQHYPGPNFEYPLLEKSLLELSKIISAQEIKKVLFPAIGCGIGGGNFYVVVGIITKWYKENFIDKNIDLNISVYFPY